MDVKTFNTERPDFPHELLEKAKWSDVVVLQMSKPENLKPLTGLEIAPVAERFVKEILALKDCKLLSFRQSILNVPIVRADFKLKDVRYRFYIYGADKEVYFPNGYPSNSCCIIS
jgi:hypothetical protein